MNVLFMGTPDFAEESLKAIHEKGHNIIGVVTNLDKPKGRGSKTICIRERDTNLSATKSKK